jgi:hypothetical protein
MTPQTAIPAYEAKPPRPSLFGKRYPTPAYCGQCDQVLEGWFETTVGVGALSQRRWQCPRCGMKVPDDLMQPDNPPIQKEKTTVTGLVVHDKTNAALSVNERTEFQQLETVIQTGLQTFFEVGNALMEIRDRRLYRESHMTFEDYCNERWQFSARQANRLIGAAQVVETLRPIGPLPENEAQARPLTQLAPERRVEAWQRAVATAPEGKVTAAHVQQVVNEALGRTGRFENKKWYPVNDRDKVVYRQPSDKMLYRSEAGIFYGCEFRAAATLNQEKQYNAYTLVDVPDYAPSTPLTLKPSKDWLQYPVSEKDKTVYDDPHDYGHKPGYYEHCEWLTLSDLRSRWSSIFYRYGDFQIVPALQAPTAWLAKALFQPGLYAQCTECSKHAWVPHNGVFPFEQWVVDGDGIWACPHGHRKADPLMTPVDASALTAPATSGDEDPDGENEDDDDEKGEPEDDDPLTGELEEVLDLVGSVVELIGLIRSNRELVESALQTEVVGSYNEIVYQEDLTAEDIAAVQKLIECFGAPVASTSETEVA